MHTLFAGRRSWVARRALRSLHRISHTLVGDGQGMPRDRSWMRDGADAKVLLHIAECMEFP